MVQEAPQIVLEPVKQMVDQMVQVPMSMPHSRTVDSYTDDLNGQKAFGVGLEKEQVVQGLVSESPVEISDLVVRCASDNLEFASEAASGVDLEEVQVVHAPPPRHF